MDTHSHTRYTRISSKTAPHPNDAAANGNADALSAPIADSGRTRIRSEDPIGYRPSSGTLRVNLLGGMEVLVDGVPYDHPFLHRQKVKTLLAALVLSEGRELNTEYLQTLIWPNSSAEKNRNNFNNLWSLLRKSLAGGKGGTCPYVQRHQGTCKLDRTQVDSDIFELHAICDAFQFGDPDLPEAISLYRRLQKIYRGDLLPGEDEMRLVVHDRRRWRNRTVDALHSMALSLKAQSAAREAGWFAQAALSLDPSREDILRLFMRLSLDQGNPSCALMQFALTSRTLGEQYGLDPHPETLDLAREAMGERAVQAKTPVRAHVSKDPCAPGRVRPRMRPTRKSDMHPAGAGSAEVPAYSFRPATGSIPSRGSR